VSPPSGEFRLEDWIEKLAEAASQTDRPSLFVGHGLGASAIVHAASRLTAGTVGAFLVVPPEEEALASLPVPLEMQTYPRDPLPFPSVLVASRSHPGASYAALEDLSYAWGSRLLDAGEAGTLDTASGHGPWPEGLMSFAGFLRQL
jgi:predicted alpha/beta hydrolase family esterase